MHTNGSMYVLLTRDPAASAACTRSHSQIRVRPESSEPPEKNVRGGTTSTTRLILSSFHHSLHPFSTLSLSPIFPSYFVSSVTVGSKPKPQDQLRLKSRQGTNIEEEQLRQAPSPSISLPGLRPVFSTKPIAQAPSDHMIQSRCASEVGYRTVTRATRRILETIERNK